MQVAHTDTLPSTISQAIIRVNESSKKVEISRMLSQKLYNKVILQGGAWE